MLHFSCYTGYCILCHLLRQLPYIEHSSTLSTRAIVGTRFIRVAMNCRRSRIPFRKTCYSDMLDPKL